MTVSGMFGFEGRIAAVSGSNSITLTGTAAISQTQARTGSSSLRCNPASGASGYVVPSGTSGDYVHFGLYVATKPSLDRVVAGQIGGGVINVRLTSAGALAVYINTTLIGTSAATFATTGWHWVGVRQVTGTSVVFLQIDGVDAVTGTATVTTKSGSVGFVGTEASAVDAYIDDIIWDSGFLAPSKVGLAIPIGTTANTAVTDANGGTTNIWEGINNLPPAGVASANEAANPNASIKFPASATESYEATLQTYTTVGVASGDTVIAVQGLFRHGEDAATGTKNGTYVGITNPTVTQNAAFTFGNDAGAHGAEAGLWATLYGTLTTGPTVVLGTSPTIKVTRASETRVGCIDFMGMWVAWTPVTAVVSIPTAASLTASGATPVIASTLSVPAASLTATGATPTVTLGTPVLPAAASLAVTGSVPVIASALSVAAASLTLTGATPTIALPVACQPTATSLTATGSTPVIASVLSVPAASLTLAGGVPVIDADVVYAPDAASLTLSGATPTVTATTNVFALPTAASLVISPTVGSVTIVTLQDGGPSQNEIQTVTVSATGGTWQLSMSGGGAWATHPMAWDISVAGLQAALDFATAPGLTVVSGSVGSYVIEFVSGWGLQDWPQMTANATNLTGGGFVPTVTVTDNLTAVPTAASLTLAGSVPSIAASALPTSASLVLSGDTPAVVTPVSTQPTEASLTLTGATPDVAASADVVSEPTAASLSLAGDTPVVAAGGSQSRQPDAAALVVSGDTPVVTTTANVFSVPNAAALVLAGDTPAIVLPVAAEPTPASLTLTGDTPAVATPVAAVPDAASLVLTGDVPAIDADVVYMPDEAAIVLTGATPAVDVGGNQTITPSLASLVLTTDTPQVGEGVSVPAASLTLTGATPAIVMPVVALPTAASLSLTGATPVIGRQVIPPLRALTLTGATPVVVVRSNVSVLPVAASLTATGATPVIRERISVPPVALHLIGDTPVITKTAHLTVIPSAPTLRLVGKRPLVDNGVRETAGGWEPPVERIPNPIHLYPRPRHLRLIGARPDVRIVDDGDVLALYRLIA